MYKPSLKNNWSLIGLCLLSLVTYYIAQTSYKTIQAPWYNEKVESSKLMERSMDLLKNEVLTLGYNIDRMNDPNETGLMGSSVSTITTSRGSLSERLVTLNPNYSAVMVDLLKRSNLKEGDYVAVGITGANPGANLALFSAMEILKLKPIIVVSVGSSTYGANRELFTWVDMENALNNNHLISFKSQFATLGGTNDIGRGLPPEGRDNLNRAIIRNNVQLLSGQNMEENIKLRLNAYETQLPSGKKYSAFINIGAGVGNVGSVVNAKIIPTGINHKLADKEFKEPGIAMLFAKKNIPVIHIYNVMKLAKEYKLPQTPVPMPKSGIGSIFSSQVNNVIVAIICWIILMSAIIAVIIFDRHDRHFMSNIVDPDEDL